MKPNLVILLLSLFIGLQSAHGGQGCLPHLQVSQRIGPIQAEFRSRIEPLLDRYFRHSIENSDFRVDRGLTTYLGDFYVRTRAWPWSQAEEYSLARSLSRLNKNSHILDPGAGLFLFVDQYANYPGLYLKQTMDKMGGFYGITHELMEKAQRNDIPNITGVSLVNFSNLSSVGSIQNGHVPKYLIPSLEKLKRNSKINALTGRYIEDIPNDELMGSFGKVNLMVDDFGAFAYTLNLGLLIEKAATIMALDAELWLRRDYGTSIMLPNKRSLSLSEFLVYTGLFEPVSFDMNRGYKATQPKLLRRTTKPVFLPNVELIEFIPRKDGGCPDRRFRFLP